MAWKLAEQVVKKQMLKDGYRTLDEMSYKRQIIRSAGRVC